MSARSERLLAQYGERIIAFRPEMAKVAGDIVTGLWLSQALFWQARTTDEEGWWSRTQADFEAETMISTKQHARCRKALKSLGVLEEKREGLPARLSYRLDLEVLDALLADLFDAGKQDSPDGQVCGSPSGESYLLLDECREKTPNPLEGGSLSSSPKGVTATATKPPPKLADELIAVYPPHMTGSGLLSRCSPRLVKRALRSSLGQADPRVVLAAARKVPKGSETGAAAHALTRWIRDRGWEQAVNRAKSDRERNLERELARAEKDQERARMLIECAKSDEMLRLRQKQLAECDARVRSLAQRLEEVRR